MRIATAILVCTLLGAQAGAQNICARIFTTSVPAKVGPSPLAWRGDLNSNKQRILLKVAEWNKAISSARDMRQAKEIEGEISSFAASLIKEHKNEEFLFLASQVEFPLNRMSYEGHDTMFFYYGTSLLEVAILSRNYEIYQRLPTLARENRWSRDEDVVVYKWTQALAKAVFSDPVFSRDLLVIRHAVGPELHQRLADAGHIPTRTLEDLQQIRQSKDINELAPILRDLFPSGDLAVQVTDKKSAQKLEATLKFEHTGYQQHSDPWIQISIRDPREFVEGIFESRFKVENKFNLQLYSFESNNYRPLRGREKNWIREMDVSDTAVRILLERDKLGVFYDRGTVFQELTLHRNPETGRIERVSIRNGDNILFRSLWRSQTVEVPTSTVSSGRVGFGGEDGAHTQLGD